MTKEFEDWPVLHFNSRGPACPFDQPEPATSGTKPATSSSGKYKQLKISRTKATSQHGSSGRTIGYCELCDANYRGLRQHLRGIRHMRHASNPEEFKELDDTINEGTTIDEYFKTLELAIAKDSLPETQNNKLEVFLYRLEIEPTKSYKLVIASFKPFIATTHPCTKYQFAYLML